MRSLFIVLALAATASAQEAITARDLENGAPWGAHAGKTLAVEGKFLGYDSGFVRLAKVGRERLVLDTSTPEGDALGGTLAGFQHGKLDKKGRSNVRVLGVAQDGDRGRMLLVSKVVRLPSDVEKLRERAAEPGADLDALAREAASLARETGDAELAEGARAVLEASLDARRAKATDAKAAIELARDYRDLAHVTSKAVSVLAEHAEDAAARALLEELDAAQHRGRWISRDQFRTELGQVCVNGKWVTRLHAELEEEALRQAAAAKARTTSLRMMSRPLYEKAAAEHRLAEGMLKPEAATAKGFATSVERITDSQGVVWDQWVLGDGTRAYFMRAPGDESLLVSWR